LTSWRLFGRAALLEAFLASIDTGIGVAIYEPPKHEGEIDTINLVSKSTMKAIAAIDQAKA
jgi:hypothetical protein